MPPMGQIILQDCKTVANILWRVLDFRFGLDILDKNEDNWNRKCFIGYLAEVR